MKNVFPYVFTNNILGAEFNLGAELKFSLETYEKMVAKAYQTGKALNYASLFSVDDTIDPADSRHWVSNIMKSIRREPKGPGKRRASIDAW